MAYLVRKISRAKWPECTCSVTNIPGDAISDLRTSSNTLSFWHIESLDDLESAALALAASSCSEDIDSFSVVWLNEEEIRKESIEIDECSPGNTIIADLVNRHRDLCSITLGTLSMLSEKILNNIHANNWKRYTRSQVMAVLVNAYNRKRISKELCKPLLWNKIEHEAM